MKTKDIPLKNYIILAVILIISIIVVIYFYKWYGVYVDNKVNTSVMDEYLNVINYNELDNYLVENKDAVIYISVLDDSDTRKFENKFKDTIKHYELYNSILYLVLSSESLDAKLYENIKSEYKFNNLPSIIIYRNGSLYDVYDIKDNDYNVNKLVTYLKNEGVIND